MTSSRTASVTTFKVVISGLSSSGKSSNIRSIVCSFIDSRPSANRVTRMSSYFRLDNSRYLQVVSASVQSSSNSSIFISSFAIFIWYLK